MFTYQVKIKINESVEAQWLEWMKTKHVPDVIASGLVCSFQILKPNPEEHLYLFHYHFQSQEDFAVYEKDFAPELKAQVQQTFIYEITFFDQYKHQSM